MGEDETGGRAGAGRGITIPIGAIALEGSLVVPEPALGVVLFAHGSGSGRHSPRNRYVAGVLQEGGIATLLIDLLTEAEEQVDLTTRHLRFDIPLLAERLDRGDRLAGSREPSTVGVAGRIVRGQHGWRRGTAGIGCPARSGCGQWCRAVGGPIWRTRHCRGSSRRHC